MRTIHILLLGCVGSLAAACSSPTPAPGHVVAVARPTIATSTPAATAPADRAEVVLLGDSLTAGLGLAPEDSFAAILQRRLDAKGLGFTIVNAGVSGDTSAGGRRRLEWSLQDRPRVLVVALGGNDGLRGLPVADLRDNLAAIIEGGQQAGATVILAGMEAPPNNGPEYTARFRQVYTDLAAEYDVALIPFLLQGVAGDPAFNQADGIHPNVEGARRVADIVWQTLEAVLARTATR